MNRKATPITLTAEEEQTLKKWVCSAKTEHGVDVGVDRKTFDEQIAAQKKKIEERLGREVHFELRVEDDQVRVVARKIKKK